MNTESFPRNKYTDLLNPRSTTRKRNNHPLDQSGQVNHTSNFNQQRRTGFITNSNCISHRLGLSERISRRDNLKNLDSNANDYHTHEMTRHIISLNAINHQPHGQHAHTSYTQNNTSPQVYNNKDFENSSTSSTTSSSSGINSPKTGNESSPNRSLNSKEHIQRTMGYDNDYDSDFQPPPSKKPCRIAEKLLPDLINKMNINIRDLDNNENNENNTTNTFYSLPNNSQNFYTSDSISTALSLHKPHELVSISESKEIEEEDENVKEGHSSYSTPSSQNIKCKSQDQEITSNNLLKSLKNSTPKSSSSNTENKPLSSQKTHLQNVQNTKQQQQQQNQHQQLFLPNTIPHHSQKVPETKISLDSDSDESSDDPFGDDDTDTNFSDDEHEFIRENRKNSDNYCRKYRQHDSFTIGSSSYEDINMITSLSSNPMDLIETNPSWKESIRQQNLQLDIYRPNTTQLSILVDDDNVKVRNARTRFNGISQEDSLFLMGGEPIRSKDNFMDQSMESKSTCRDGDRDDEMT